ncbi:glycosyl hydrolase [Bisporella sp. PMI_857]|nr:glycosyl hydrolase [Bisporella sp. PMI_857]
MLLLQGLFLLLATLHHHVLGSRGLSTYINPILPGWNSDPSCVFVKEADSTFFCTTPSFLVFPGVPVYASKDLASTIRYSDGVVYIITSYVSFAECYCLKLLLFFSTRDPHKDSAWAQPLSIENPANEIDPDLFFDNIGKVYVSVSAGMWIFEVDLKTGKAGEPFKVWNGTGDRNPEGPRLYKKDIYYYLLLAEGGTETNHSVTIARSRNIRGPYLGDPHNPILTAKNTPNFFQTVGHADIFPEAKGNWWAVALATRSAPAWKSYPMGRETVLVPVEWKGGQFPVIAPVMGRMAARLPPRDKSVRGDGPWWDDDDKISFPPRSKLPKHFVHWRPPVQSLVTVSPPERPGTLKVFPSRVNLTGDSLYNSSMKGIGFVARKQTSSFFEFSVDVAFKPTKTNQEAGISVLLTQWQHIDLGIVNLSNLHGPKREMALRFRVEASGKPGRQVPKTKAIPTPK